MHSIFADLFGIKRRRLQREEVARKAAYQREQELREKMARRHDAAFARGERTGPATSGVLRQNTASDTTAAQQPTNLLTDPLNPANPVGLLNPGSPVYGDYGSGHKHHNACDTGSIYSSHGGHSSHDSGSSSYSGSSDSGSSSSSGDSGGSSGGCD